MILNQLTRMISLKAPVILTGAGIVGFITGAVIAVKNTPEAMDILSEARDDVVRTKSEDILRKAILVFPVYASSIGIFMASAAAVIGSNTISNRRIMGLGSLLMYNHNYIHSLQSAMFDKLGDKKATEVLSAANSIPEDTRPIVMLASGKTTLFFDHYSARYFELSSVEALRTVINNLNDTLFRDGWVPINDFYYELELTKVQFGDEIGWSVENGQITYRIDSMLTKENSPCVTVQFSNIPIHIVIAA